MILAGGSGTRFWPRSREALPKQCLAVSGEQALLRGTFDRLQAFVSPERIWVLTNEALRRQVARQLPEVSRRQIIAEPVQRNTAPAIALAARLLLIKSQALLPKPPEIGITEIDPGEELAKQLRMYKKFKDMSEWLDARVSECPNVRMPECLIFL